MIIWKDRWRSLGRISRSPIRAINHADNEVIDTSGDDGVAATMIRATQSAKTSEWMPLLMWRVNKELLSSNFQISFANAFAFAHAHTHWPPIYAARKTDYRNGLLPTLSDICSNNFSKNLFKCFDPSSAKSKREQDARGKSRWQMEQIDRGAPEGEGRTKKYLARQAKQIMRCKAEPWCCAKPVIGQARNAKFPIFIFFEFKHKRRWWSAQGKPTPPS